MYSFYKNYTFCCTRRQKTPLGAPWGADDSRGGGRGGGPAEGGLPEAKALGGGPLSAPLQYRFSATALIARRRKQQHLGWLPLGWLQQEAMHPALISLKQEAIYVAVVFDFSEGSRPFGVRRFDLPEAGVAQ